MAKDPAVSGTSHEILNDYIMDVYPEKVIKSERGPASHDRLHQTGPRISEVELGIEGYFEMYHLDGKAVDDLSAKIKAVLDSTPVLKY
jgi:hypothetical protein